MAVRYVFSATFAHSQPNENLHVDWLALLPQFFGPGFSRLLDREKRRRQSPTRMHKLFGPLAVLRTIGPIWSEFI